MLAKNIGATRRTGPSVPREREFEMYYVIYREANSHLWRWTLYGPTDRKIAESVEKHYNKADCLMSIETVKGSGSVPVRER